MSNHYLRMFVKNANPNDPLAQYNYVGAKWYLRDQSMCMGIAMQIDQPLPELIDFAISKLHALYRQSYERFEGRWYLYWMFRSSLARLRMRLLHNLHMLRIKFGLIPANWWEVDG